MRKGFLRFPLCIKGADYQRVGVRCFGIPGACILEDLLLGKQGVRGRGYGLLPVIDNLIPVHYLHFHRITLDGTWKFLFSKNNDLCPKDFHKPGFSTRKWGKIEVPGSWELQGFDAPIYTDTRYPFPPNPPYVPTDYNPGL